MLRMPPTRHVCVFALLVVFGCSDDSVKPLPTDPIPGHMYNWAGTGEGGAGAMGQLPGETQLYWPVDVAFAPDGSPVVVDFNNHRVIGVDRLSGRFELIAGGAFGAPCPPPPATCDSIVAAGARINHPTSVVFDASGRMVLCAWHNSELFLLDMNTGLMNRFCGTGIRPCFGPVGNDPQPAISACVDLPASVVFDPHGRLCFTDQANMIVRMIDENGTIHTIAGTQPIWDGTRWTVQYGFSGDEGLATSAKFNFERGRVADPSGRICFDAGGSLFVTDTMNHCVRVVDTSGIIHRFAGLDPATSGYDGDGGPATSAKLNAPRDVASDSDGNIFIADTGNQCIRVVDTAGVIHTVAGVPRGRYEWPPKDPEDGQLATKTALWEPRGIAIDADNNLWIADTEYNLIRIVYRPMSVISK